MISTSLLAIAPLIGAAPQAAVEYAWTAPDFYVAGSPFPVSIVVEAGAEGASLDGWLISPAAFSVDGKAIGKRKKGASLELVPSSRLELELDLAPWLAEAVQGDFELGFARVEGEPRKVRAFEKAAAETDFMTLPAEQLAEWTVVMQTNRGVMVLEFWPEVAPNHVRNFLDLSHTGFYDQVLFHRVIPGFMIQGGDPYTKDPEAPPQAWGTGAGPRVLDAEFNERKHVRGVLSMARTQDPNSATSQFFICHATASNLDNQYSAFGKLVSGYEALDRIVNAECAMERGRRGSRPVEPQRIERAQAVRPMKSE